MTKPYKPRAPKRGRRPQKRGPSLAVREAAHDAKRAEKRRLLSLTGLVATMESRLDRLEEMVYGHDDAGEE